jgi:hypothetical protein
VTDKVLQKAPADPKLSKCTVSPSHDTPNFKMTGLHSLLAGSLTCLTDSVILRKPSVWKLRYKVRRECHTILKILALLKEAILNVSFIELIKGTIMFIFFTKKNILR